MSWADTGGPGAVPPAVAAGLEPGRLAAGVQRRLGVPPSVARQHLLRSVRDLAFDLKIEQLSLLEAVRGSRLGGVTLSPTQVPVLLRVTLEADGPGVRVGVLLVDRWPGRLGRNWGVTSVYVGLFESVLSTFDAVLGRLDPTAAASFTPWWRQTGPGDVAMMQHAAGLANRAQAAFSRHAGRLLDGDGQAHRQAVVTRTGGATFTFVTADAVAEVPAELADGMLMVGTLIVSRPGACHRSWSGRCSRWCSGSRNTSRPGASTGSPSSRRTCRRSPSCTSRHGCAACCRYGPCGPAPPAGWRRSPTRRWNACRSAPGGPGTWPAASAASSRPTCSPAGWCSSTTRVPSSPAPAARGWTPTRRW